MSKAAAITFLEEQLQVAEAEVQALRLVLERYRGGAKEASASIVRKSPQTSMYSQGGQSVGDMVHRALHEAGKPQTTAQLLSFLASHGKTTSSATLRGSIHQFIKQGKRFKAIAPGLYGLIEWKD